MKSHFSYQVRGTLYRNNSDSIDFVEVNEVFKHENPIEARELAFNFYQNYIDVFLENLGKTYVNHEETLFWLRDFIKNKKESFQKVGNELLWQIDEDFDKGLFVYLVQDENDKFETLEGETVYNNKIQIHRLDYSPDDLYDDLYINLVKEFEMYEKNNYEIKNYKIDNNKHTIDSIDGNKPILKTPINFK